MISSRPSAVVPPRLWGLTVTSAATPLFTNDAAGLLDCLDALLLRAQRSHVSSSNAADGSLAVLRVLGNPHRFRAPILRHLSSASCACCLGPTLRVLHINNNELDEVDDLAAALAAIPRLEELSLRQCAAMSHLQGLQIPIMGVGLGEFKLRKIDLTGCRKITTLGEVTKEEDGGGGGSGTFLWLEELEEINIANTGVSSLLPLQHSRGLRKVFAAGCRKLSSLQGLENHAHFEEINAAFSSITSLRPLRGCRALRRVDFRLCKQLKSIEGLGAVEGEGEMDRHGADNDDNRSDQSNTENDKFTLCKNMFPLHTLNVSYTSISSLRPLLGRCCATLRVVDAHHCPHLSSLEGLEGCFQLEELNASYTSVSSLRPPQKCRALRKVALESCGPALTTLEGLGGDGDGNNHHHHGHDWLEELNVAGNSIVDLRPLQSSCPRLRVLDVSRCSAISSLEGVGGHFTLAELKASFTAIRSLQPLQTCRALKKLDVSFCEGLTSLEGIGSGGGGEGTTSSPLATDAAASSVAYCTPLLETLDVSGTALTSLRPLQGCHALRTVCLRRCSQLETLEGLKGGPNLEELNPSGTAISSLQPLQRRGEGPKEGPHLKKVCLRGCHQLTALDGLEAHTRLVEVDVAFSAVTSLRPLEACRLLQKVDVTGCTNISK